LGEGIEGIFGGARKSKATRGYYMKFLFFIALLFPLSGCQYHRQLDSHGNPVFNSVALEDSLIHPEKGIASNYYTVGNNIANPYSSVFVSKNPSEDEIWDFVMNKPSYFFIIHNRGEVCAIAGLWPKSRDWLTGGWEWKIVNPNTYTEKTIESKIQGPVAEHRLRESKSALAKKDHPYIEKGKSILAPKGNRIYKIANYQDIFSEIISIAETNDLWNKGNRL
jgi:hypothetical protein